MYRGALGGWEECCPFCGGSDLEEAERCPVCGAALPVWELEGGLCPRCGEAALARLQKLVGEKFSPEEAAFLESALLF